MSVQLGRRDATIRLAETAIRLYFFDSHFGVLSLVKFGLKNIFTDVF